MLKTKLKMATLATKRKKSPTIAILLGSALLLGAIYYGFGHSAPKLNKAPESVFQAVSKGNVAFLDEAARIASATAHTINRHGCPPDEFIQAMQTGLCGFKKAYMIGAIPKAQEPVVLAALAEIQRALDKITASCGGNPAPCNTMQ